MATMMVQSAPTPTDEVPDGPSLSEIAVGASDWPRRRPSPPLKRHDWCWGERQLRLQGAPVDVDGSSPDAIWKMSTHYVMGHDRGTRRHDGLGRLVGVDCRTCRSNLMRPCSGKSVQFDVRDGMVNMQDIGIFARQLPSGETGNPHASRSQQRSRC